MDKLLKIIFTLFVNIIFVGFGIYTNFAFNNLIKTINNKINQETPPLELTTKEEESLGSAQVVIYVVYNLFNNLYLLINKIYIYIYIYLYIY